MRIELTSTPFADLGVDLIAVPVFENELGRSWAFRAVDAPADGLLSRTLADEGFSGAREKTELLHLPGRLRARRVLVVGMGPRRAFRPADARLLGVAAARAAGRHRARRLGVAAPRVPARQLEATLEALGSGLELGVYRYGPQRNGSPQSEARSPRLRRALVAPPPDAPGLAARAAGAALARGQDVGRSINDARDLVNGPANEVTPSRLADFARALARKHDLDVKILDAKKCEKLGMGLFLAVAQGSREPPRFIHLRYDPPGKKPRPSIALVGKGVTFDSGGLSLKTAKQMEAMKADMAGGAAVLAAVAAIARRRPHVRVHAICAATENMPSGAAYRPGDVFRSMGGRTVEVLNTDAEGRLTLGDAIHYAARLGVDEIVELSTLTGACMVALGRYTAAVLSRDDALARRLLEAAAEAGEDFWRLPLVDRLAEDLQSDAADCKNIGTPYGGAISAGHFLMPFAGEVPFAHCDIAGPAWAEKPWGIHPRGATGVGVLTLVEHAMRLARSAG